MSQADDLLRIDVDHREGTARVAPIGELDLGTAPRLRTVLRGLWNGEPPRKVVLDLRELSFLDSTGLEVILRAEAEARSNDARFSIIQATPHIHRVFVITGLDQHLHTTVERPELPAA